MTYYNGQYVISHMRFQMDINIRNVYSLFYEHCYDW